jgi:hypothetical protein
VSIDDAIIIAREVEAKEHRHNGIQRGRLVHDAIELVIKAAESNIQNSIFNGMQFK